MSAKKSNKKPVWTGFSEKSKKGELPEILIEKGFTTSSADDKETQSVIVKYTAAGMWEGTVGNYQKFEIPDTALNDEEGKPAIPKTGIFVAVSETAENLKIEAIDKSTRKISGVKLLPVQKEFIESEYKEVYEPDPEVYGSDKPYPGVDFEFLGLKTVNDIHVAHILVNLGQYRPKASVLELVESISLEVSWDKPKDVFTTQSKRIKRRPPAGLIHGIETLGEDLFDDDTPIDPEEYEEFKQADTDGPTLKVKGKISEYVIITTPALQASVSPLLTAKQNWPHYGSVALTTVIQSEFPAANLKESIRNFLVWAWANWKVPPRFVVLAGDTDVIPMHYYTVRNGASLASDHYYANISGDDVPEASVSRIPTSNATTMRTVCTHLARYRTLRGGDWGGWQNNVMLCAYQNKTYEDNCDQLTQKLKSRYNVIQRYAKNTNRDDVVKTMNSGVVMALYRGHGSKTNWSSSNGLNTTEIARLTNENLPPFVMNICCQNGWIDDTRVETVAEALIRRRKAVATFASSRDSWTAANNDFSKYLIDAVMIGKCVDPAYIVTYAKTKMLRNHSTSTTHLDNLRMYNLFGDPTVHVASDAEWLRGTWAVNSNGTAATLKVDRIWNNRITHYDGKAATVWDISGQFTTGGKSYEFTGTVGGFDSNHSSTKAGRSDHKVEFTLTISQAPLTKIQFNYIGYLHTTGGNQLSGMFWSKTKIAAITMANPKPNGWTAKRT